MWIKQSPTFAVLFVLLVIAVLTLQGGIIPAIIPAAVPTANKTASGTVRFLICDTNENCVIKGAFTSGTGGSAVGALDLNDPTNGGTGTLSWPGSASNFTWTLPAVTGTLPIISGTPTAGNCAQWVTATTIGQGSAACGSGGGGGGGGFPGWSGSISNTNLALCTPCFVPANGGGASNTSESAVLANLPYAATGNDLYVSDSVAPGAGNSIAFTIRHAGAGSGVTCTISGGSATTCNDTTHTFTGAAGDTVSIQISVTGTPGTSEFTINWNYGGSSTPSGLTLLYTATASNSASLAATTRNAPGQSGNLFQTDFQNYMVRATTLVPASNAVQLQLQFSANAGSTWIATGYQWSYGFSGSGGGGLGQVNSNSDTQISLANANSNGANMSTSFVATVNNPLAGIFTAVPYATTQYNSGDSNLYSYNGTGALASATAVNAMRIQFSSGNISSGQLQVYGFSH